MRNTVRSRLVTEQCHDEEVRPYIQQLMKTQSCSQVQTSEDTNSIDVAELNNEPCPSKTSKKKFSIPICGEEFVKKSIGKKWRDYKCDLKAMYVTKYKTKDALMKNRPAHIPRDQWNSLVSYWLSEKHRFFIVLLLVLSKNLSVVILAGTDVLFLILEA
uniref:Uncharacterized protein n=1 Tax=Solanum lycopersicum TaxID=4081 RepID=A0A3Q7IYH5_SOLLC